MEDRRNDDGRLNRVEVALERVSTMMQNNEERYKRDHNMWTEVAQKMEKLSERLSASDGLGKEVSTLAGDVRALRHDFRNFENSLNGLPLLAEKVNANITIIATHDTRLSAHDGRLKALEDRNIKEDGASEEKTKTAGWVWATLSSIGTFAVGLFMWWLNQRTGGISGE